MICPNCLANNKNNAIKCQSCGYDLVQNDLDFEEENEKEKNDDYASDSDEDEVSQETITITPVKK